MSTSAVRYACPVCSEGYDTRPEQCFRCETPLRAWWPFEDAARATVSLSPEPAARRSSLLLPMASAALAGALLAAVSIALWRPAPRVVPAPATVAESPRAAQAPAAAAPAETPGLVPAVTYRVQPGDSLWRIAAALTGDGRNWKRLWPSASEGSLLAVGTTLEVGEQVRPTLP